MDVSEQEKLIILPVKAASMTSQSIPHLLIDTNILIKLVSPNTRGILLRKIKGLAESGKVKILVPEKLLEEWPRNSANRKGEILKDISRLAQRNITTMHKQASYTTAQLDHLRSLVGDQLQDIDDLLKNGIQVPKTEAIQLFIDQQQQNGKAPFHKQKKRIPIADAEIIYSSLFYCRDNKLGQLFLCTDNPDDFSVSKTIPDQLHPDYREHFPSVQVLYFRNSDPLLKQLDAMGFRIVLKNDDLSLEPADLAVPFIDRSLPILDQVYVYLKQVFEEVSILPKAFFAEQYPFLTRPKDHYEQAFTIVTDNEEVYNLLQVQAIDGEVKDSSGLFIKNEDDQTMIRGILKTLAVNNISKVSIKNRPAVDLVYSEKYRVCNCCLCRFQRLDWKPMARDLYKEQKEDSSQEDQMKRAYVMYKLCDFKNSATEFERIYEHPETTPVHRYICAFNLVRLAKMLSTEYSNEGEIHLLQRRIEGIDLEEVKNETIKDKPIAKCFIEWLHDRVFLSDATTLISESETTVRYHYYSQSSGHNEYTLNAIEMYGFTERLLDYNYIVFDKFSEFTKLSRSYIELLYASYGCSSQMGGRLIHFSDHLLHSLVLHGDENLVRRFSARYQAKDAVYFHSATDNFQFVPAVHRLLRQYPELIKMSYGWKGFYYDQYLRDISSQIFQLLCTLELPPESWKMIGEGIVHLLSKSTVIDFKLFGEINQLLHRQGKNFETDFLVQLMDIFLERHELYSEELCQGVTSELRKRKVYALDDARFEKILQYFTGDCPYPDCHRDHSDTMLTDLWVFMSEEQRKQIAIILKQQLAETFVPYKYYRFVMHDMIKPTTDLQAAYIEHNLEIIAKQEPRPWFIARKDYADPRTDQFLNYCFKYNVQLPEQTHKILEEKSSYYKWLLNPDEFDYSYFKEEWLSIHYTIYYKKRFYKSTHLKEYLLKRLQSNPTPALDRKYIEIQVLPHESPDS